MCAHEGYTYTRKAHGPFARKPCPEDEASSNVFSRSSSCFLFAIFHRERFSTCLFRKKVAVRSSPRRIEAINDRAPNYPFASWSSVRSFKLDSRGNTKPRPILYTRYCVQVIYRLELGKGKGGYFYLYFSPRLNARLNEEDNFLKFSAVYDPCFTIVFEIRGRLIKTRYFTVELIAGGGGRGRGETINVYVSRMRLLLL